MSHLRCEASPAPDAAAPEFVFSDEAAHESEEEEEKVDEQEEEMATQEKKDPEDAAILGASSRFRVSNLAGAKRKPTQGKS